jgi:hypothetical protein
MTLLARFQNNVQVYGTCQRLVLKLLKAILEQDVVKLEMY